MPLTFVPSLNTLHHHSKYPLKIAKMVQIQLELTSSHRYQKYMDKQLRTCRMAVSRMTSFKCLQGKECVVSPNHTDLYRTK